MTVLLVEADAAGRRAVQRCLEPAGYVVSVASTYAAAAGRLARQRYDFVVLAPALPDGDGLELLREAVGEGEQAASFIVLTASPAVEDRLRGFALGADDCLSKPFAPAELERRMRTITRQRAGRKRPEIHFGAGFALDVAARRLRHGPHTVPLSRSQFDLLHHLLHHRGKSLTRHQLGLHIGRGASPHSMDSNFINVHVKNVRKALSRFAATDFLETVPGVGYRVT